MKRIILLFLVPTTTGFAQSGSTRADWPTYGGDLSSTRYSPLDQISAANFNKLQVAWRFKTDSLGPRPSSSFSRRARGQRVLYTTADEARCGRARCHDG